MNNTWMPTAAGVLNIVSGVLRLLAAISLILAITATGGAFVFTGLAFWFPINAIAILWIITIPVAASGVLALVGGVYALQRKKWGLALAGSIAAFFPFGFLGLVSVILTAMSRDQFKTGEVTA